VKFHGGMGLFYGEFFTATVGLGSVLWRHPSCGCRKGVSGEV